jgi:hypothetical protein
MAYLKAIIYTVSKVVSITTMNVFEKITRIGADGILTLDHLPFAAGRVLVWQE